MPAHPSDYILHALGSGTLDDAGAGAVVAHLEACADCRARASTICGDGFLDRLRAARLLSPDKPEPADTTASPPARAPAAPAAPAVPLELCDHPQYEVVRELGRGGMGIVYLARNRLLDRPEVLKVVNQRLLNRPETAERFLREVRSAAQLSHPNIVTAYSALRVGDLLVFAMEYVEGEDLAKVVKARGPLPVAHACHYAQQAALGLQHACTRGLVHRDIKPHNLILARDGKRHVIKVLDFGLAKATREQEGKGHHDLTGSGQMLGTPEYVAPEQIVDAAKADIRADIYSLGCTLYFLLSGRPPFRADSLFELMVAHRSATAPPLHQVRAEVPAELAAVVARLLAKEPGQRYRQPVEVAQALAPFVKPGARSAAALPNPAAPPAPVPSDKAARLPGDPNRVKPVRAEPVPRPAGAVERRRGWLGCLAGVAGAALAVLGTLVAVEMRWPGRGLGSIAWVASKVQGGGPVKRSTEGEVRKTDDRDAEQGEHSAPRPAPKPEPPAPPSDDARRKHNAEVVKMQRCLDDFRQKDHGVIQCWNDHINDSRYDKKSVYRECLRLARTIDPYSPAGVNAELAAAVRAVRDAHIALYEAALRNADTGGADQQDSYRQAVNRARDDLNAVVNRLEAQFNNR
jgi:serine/threonine protein kinase